MNDLVRRNDPFDIFSRFGDLFDREPVISPAKRADWMPPVDIRESEQGSTFQMDVPGLKPEDLDVELHEVSSAFVVPVPRKSRSKVRATCVRSVGREALRGSSECLPA